MSQTDPTPAFTPGQGVLCTLLGGPLAGTYALVASLRAVGRHWQARTVLAVGCLVALGMAGVFPFLHLWAALANFSLLALAAIAVREGLRRLPGRTEADVPAPSPLRVAAVCLLGLPAYLLLIAAFITLYFEWNLLPGA